MTGFGKQRWAS